jgi:hypothetical protein
MAASHRPLTCPVASRCVSFVEIAEIRLTLCSNITFTRQALYNTERLRPFWLTKLVQTLGHLC